MYIVLEGIDGAGKSTQTKLLEKWFIKKGYQTKTVVEPTESEIGKLIRKELLKKESTSDINQQKLSLLFAADRLTLKEEIMSVKNNHEKIILSDRSFYSSICYQNNKSINPEWIKLINKYTPRPDVTIILDLDENEAIKRCDKEEVFENIDFLEKTRKNYLKLLKEEENIIKIDATPTEEEVQKQIQKQIEQKLKL